MDGRDRDAHASPLAGAARPTRATTAPPERLSRRTGQEGGAQFKGVQKAMFNASSDIRKAGRLLRAAAPVSPPRLSISENRRRPPMMRAFSLRRLSSIAAGADSNDPFRSPDAASGVYVTVTQTGDDGSQHGGL